MRALVLAAALGGAIGSAGWPQANAASFDCRKASKLAELAICEDKALSAADDRLAQLYSRVLGELPPSVKPAFQKTQRSWIAYLPLACSSDGRGAVKDRPQFVQCLKSEYDVRIAALNGQPKTVGAFQTIPIGEFQAMPSSSNDPDFFPTVTHTKSVTIVFGGDDKRAAQLNGWLQTLAGTDKANWNDADTSASFDVALAAVNDVFATATLANYMFGVGAAHPLALSSTRHLILASGKTLTSRDMFQPQTRDRLTDLVWAALKKKLGNDLMIEKKSDLIKMVEDPGHWRFDRDGLTFSFNVYEVAAYVMGPQDVTLAWPLLRDMLTPLGQTIAAAAR